MWKLGYAPEDIIGNIFKVCKGLDILENLKLDFIQVSTKFQVMHIHKIQYLIIFTICIMLFRTNNHFRNSITLFSVIVLDNVSSIMIKPTIK